jgi:hypothetical protein
MQPQPQPQPRLVWVHDHDLLLSAGFRGAPIIYLERDFASQCRTDRSSFDYLREGVCNKPYQIDVVRTMVEPDPLLLRSRFIWGRRNCQDISSARRISRYCTASATQATEVYFTKYPYYKLNMFSRVYLHEEGPSGATNCEPKAVNK